MEIQEHSTRQKLEEFKRKLANSQQGHRHDSNESSLTSTSQVPKESTLGTEANTTASSPMIETNHAKLDIKSTESFQSRIQQENPNRENTIHNILSKYRSGNKDANAEARASKRTAQVDQILAKYAGGDRSKKANEHKLSTAKQASASRHLTGTNTQNPQSKPASAPSSRRQAKDLSKPSDNLRHGQSAVAHTRLKVPNSEMEYEVAVINTVTNKTLPRQIESSSTREPNTRAANSNMSRYDSFQATLQAMLEHRQGNHKRRTGAWTKTEAAQKPTNKQVSQSYMKVYISFVVVDST